MSELRNNIDVFRVMHGLEVKDLLPLCKWINRATYYSKTEDYSKVWSLEEIVALLNRFNATFEDVFMGMNTMWKHSQSAPKKNLYSSFRYYTSKRGIQKKDLYLAMGTKSRQNYSQAVRNGRFRLTQIINLLEVLNCSFQDLFLERTSFDIGDISLDEEVI
jgi:hypothetical protein